MRPLLIFAQDFSSDALSCLVVNKLQLSLKVVAIKLPFFQREELLEDISCFSNAQIVGDAFSLHSKFQLTNSNPVNYLGKIGGCTIDNKQTIMQAQQDESTEMPEHTLDRISYLENQLENNDLLGDFERELIEERIGKLKGGLCVVKAGGLSEVEVKECRERIEDALFAVRAALDQGYVTGGGFALYQAAIMLDSKLKK